MVFRMLFLVSYSYSNDLMLWFYDDTLHSLVFKSKKTVENELNVREHKPYLLTKDEHIPQMFGIEKIETVSKYDFIHDKTEHLYKIVCNNPNVIFDKRSKIGLRTKLKTCWEDDIQYAYCFTYDNRLVFGYMYPNSLLNSTFKLNDRKALEQFYNEIFSLYVPKIKYVAIDIEVRTPKSEMPSSEKADYPIVAVSFVSEELKKVLMLKDEHLIIKSQNDKEIEYVKSETELLKQTFKILNSYPFIVGYNSDDFDLQYLHNRSKKLNVESPIIIMKKPNGQTVCNLQNSIHLDLYKILAHSLIRYAFQEQLKDAENNTLEEISRVLLNETKEPMPHLELCTDIELKKRCLKDAELVYKILKLDDYKIVKLLFLLSRIINVSIQDVYRIKLTTLITKYHLNWLYRLFNILIPNKKDIENKKLLPIKKSTKKENSYEGALTLKPKPDIYFNVHVLDVPSMYPNIIDIFNIGPETVACPHKECKTNIVPEHTFHICIKNKSIFSMSIGVLKDIRIKFKKEKREEAVISTLKLFCNSSYGIYKNIIPAVASTITAYERYCFNKMIKIAEKHRIKVLYGDTDSMFVQTLNDNLNVFIEEVKKETGIGLELQKVYKHCTLWKKKNYLGITVDGKADIVGLMGKKKDVCVFFKKVFNQILGVLKNVNSYVELENAKKEIIRIINDNCKALRMREFDLKDLVIRRKLKLNDGQGQDYDVAKQYEKLGQIKKAGDYINKVLVHDRLYTAKPYELVKSKEEVNIENYIELLNSLIGQVTIPLNLMFNSQKTLMDYEGEIQFNFDDEIVFDFE